MMRESDDRAQHNQDRPVPAFLEFRHWCLGRNMGFLLRALLSMPPTVSGPVYVEGGTYGPLRGLQGLTHGGLMRRGAVFQEGGAGAGGRWSSSRPSALDAGVEVDKAPAAFGAEGVRPCHRLDAVGAETCGKSLRAASHHAISVQTLPQKSCPKGRTTRAEGWPASSR